MSRYVTLTELKAHMGIDGTTDDALLQMKLDDAEGIIEAATRRQFVGTVGTAFINRWDADGRITQGNKLWFRSDLLNVDQVILGDGQVVPQGSYWLEPNEGPPYRAIRLKTSYVFTWNTDADMTVAGTWGFSVQPPPSIRDATVRFAAHLYRVKDVGPMGDMIGGEDVGAQPVQRGIPTDVMDIIRRYRSRSGGAV